MGRLPNDADLAAIIQAAFTGARERARQDGIRDDQEWGEEWLEALAQQLERYPWGRERVEVFRRSKASDTFARTSAAQSEFLFDVLVCHIASFPPPVHAEASRIDYIVEPLLQVETELTLSTAESSVNFSKLICGAAPISLFVGPLTHGRQQSLSALENIARHMKPWATAYCAFIPPPSEWDDPVTATPELYRWRDGGWAPSVGPPQGG